MLIERQLLTVFATNYTAGEHNSIRPLVADELLVEREGSENELTISVTALVWIIEANQSRRRPIGAEKPPARPPPLMTINECNRSVAANSMPRQTHHYLRVLDEGAEGSNRLMKLLIEPQKRRQSRAWCRTLNHSNLK